MGIVKQNFVQALMDNASNRNHSGRGTLGLVPLLQSDLRYASLVEV